MTDRKLTCVACKSAITEGDIAHSDLEFGGELKATNQPEYTAGADTDLVATIGTLDEYAPMVRTTGNQLIEGITIWDSIIISNNLPIARSSPTTGKWKEIAYWDNIAGNWHAIFEVFGPLDSKYAIGFFDIATNFHGIKVISKINLDPADLALNYSDDGTVCRLMIKTTANQLNFYVKYSTNSNTYVSLPMIDGDEYASATDFPETNTIYATLRGWDAS